MRSWVDVGAGEDQYSGDRRWYQKISKQASLHEDSFEWGAFCRQVCLNRDIWCSMLSAYCLRDSACYIFSSNKLIIKLQNVHLYTKYFTGYMDNVEFNTYHIFYYICTDSGFRDSWLIGRELTSCGTYIDIYSHCLNI